MRRDDGMQSMIEAMRPRARFGGGDDPELSAMLAGPQERGDPDLEELQRAIVLAAIEEQQQQRKSSQALRGGLAASMFGNMAEEGRQRRQFDREQGGRRELIGLETERDAPMRTAELGLKQSQARALDRENTTPKIDPITEARSGDAAQRGDFKSAYELRGLPVPANAAEQGATIGADAFEQEKAGYLEQVDALAEAASDDPVEIRNRFDALTGSMRRRFPSVDTSRFASDMGNRLATALSASGKGFNDRRQPRLRESLKKGHTPFDPDPYYAEWKP